MESENGLLNAIVTSRGGSIIAPAGCGKTELIANAVVHSSDYRLILTHTHAGVDAIKKRLRDKGSKPGRQEVTTIAAWSLRMATAFPLRSGLKITMPRSTDDWDKVYAAATHLLTSGCINSIITCSYAGVLVDEYQDCIRPQHDVIKALSNLIPCCIFGDPLQAIFDFRNQPMPDWGRDVLQTFPVIRKLEHPHRWYRVKNAALGDWLMNCRQELENTGQIDLRNSPRGIVHHWLLTSDDPILRHAERRRALFDAMANRQNEQCVVIGDSRNESGRARLARDVNAVTIEPFSSKQLADFITTLGLAAGEERLAAVLKLVKAMMTKSDSAKLQKRALSGAKPSNPLDAACIAITRTQDLAPILDLLERVRKASGWVYRPELYSAVCGTLRNIICGVHGNLEDAAWYVQSRHRYSTRRFGPRTIGSTLLVKGLEFDHAIITDVDKLGQNDLYVALTRGARTVHVISSSPVLRPAKTSWRQPTPESA